MKKNAVLAISVLLCVFLTGMFYSCTVDDSRSLLLESPMTKGGLGGDSCLADRKSALLVYWESQLKNFPEVDAAMQQLIAADEMFLWNYIESSHSGWIGSYFAIPIVKADAGMINSCAIVPITPYNKGEYGLCGKLGSPFRLDTEKLDSIPFEFRYLFSLLFLQWEEKGLGVEPPLAEFARKLRNNYIPFDASPSKKRTQAVGMSRYCTVKYIVDYMITERTYVDGDEVVVNQVSMETLRELFIEAAYMLTCYDDVVGYEIRDYLPLEIVVQLKDDVHARSIIEGYMLWVKHCVREKLYCRDIFYQYCVCIDPAWAGVSGGNGGGGGGGMVGGGGAGGGIGSGGSSEIGIEPIVDVNELYDNAYIHNVFQEFARKSSIFNFMLQRFMGEHSVVHLKWQYSDTLSPKCAGMVLDTLANYNLIILLNEQLLRQYPPLCVAKTMIHELIHADILLKLLSLEKSRPANMGKNELQDLEKALNKQHYPTLRFYYDKYFSHATSQHAYMSDYLVDMIKTALKQFKPEVDEKVCEAVAWQGLKWMDVPIWDEEKRAYYYDRQQTPGWERLGEQKQREIDNIFRDYLKQN